jgi:murein DD-endopeptidase MepM/ murein hydrolase activator NlpD
MKYWPVPTSYTREIPKNGVSGSFWEDRGDRHHCGIDIYAPEGSEVLAVESGYVIETGQFTSPKQHLYWNPTFYVILKTPQNFLVKYAELKEISVRIGDYVDAGQLLGIIGCVIKKDDVTYEDPYYIQELADKGTLSMLHFEIYKAPVTSVQPYLAGNYFGDRKPESLIDPKLYLNGVSRRSDS